MINYIQAIVLGIVQGVTELFPISSLGHSVILPGILGWHIDQRDSLFVIFLVATHLATALVLLGFFFSDWVLIVKGLYRSVINRAIAPSDTYAKIGWLIIVATIPAGIIGLLLQKKLEALFASPLAAAIFLVLNGILLFGAEYLRKKSISQKVLSADAGIATMSWSQAVKIGLSQCLALIPGFSRTGATLGGGLLNRLSHEEAVRFSFLLATPIIFAAAIVKLPKLLHASGVVVGPIVIGALVAGVAAFFSVRFLTKYFKKNTLVPFALYCIIAGLVAIVILTV